MAELPARMGWPGLLPAALFACFFGLLAWSFAAVGFSPVELVAGLPAMLRIGGDMLPPDTSRWWPMTQRAWDTVQMAVVGSSLGVVVSLPIAFLAARNLSPHPALAAAVRGVVAFIRCIPDLIWALFFIASVGLGPPAGTLAIMMESIGFCGRFFAEHLEEVDPGPAEALHCIGAGRVDVLAAATLPAAMPAMVNSSLYAFDKAVRSSMILGIVGAGGIGDELMVAMEMWEFQRAGMIMLIIFVIILAAEQFGAWVRARFLPDR